DAQRRAEEIAGSAGSRVGDVISARAGVFQITEPYSTEVSGMGMYSTSTRRKEITVTVHGDFALGCRGRGGTAGPRGRGARGRGGPGAGGRGTGGPRARGWGGRTGATGRGRRGAARIQGCLACTPNANSQ